MIQHRKSELTETLGEALKREPCPECGELWECESTCPSRVEEEITTRAAQLLNGQNLSVVDWIDERYQNARTIAKTKKGEERQDWLEDASYLLRAREALKSLAQASGDEHTNVPIRMYLALKILRAWNSGTEGFCSAAVATINAWLDSGMKGPLPWPDSPFFTEWAEHNGLSNVGGYVGFKFQMNLIDAVGTEGE